MLLSVSGGNVRDLAKEKHRAMLIAYTSLWQLRELDPAGEPPHLRVARIELRRSLDESPTEDSLRQARRTHPAPVQ